MLNAGVCGSLLGGRASQRLAAVLNARLSGSLFLSRSLQRLAAVLSASSWRRLSPWCRPGVVLASSLGRPGIVLASSGVVLAPSGVVWRRPGIVWCRLTSFWHRLASSGVVLASSGGARGKEGFQFYIYKLPINRQRGRYVIPMGRQRTIGQYVLYTRQ